MALSKIPKGLLGLGKSCGFGSSLRSFLGMQSWGHTETREFSAHSGENVEANISFLKICKE